MSLEPYSNDNVLLNFLDAQKRTTRKKYRHDMTLFCQFVGMSPSQVKELREKQESSTDKEQKFYFEDKLKEFHKYLYTRYISPKGKKPLSQSSASSKCIGVRAFFKQIRSKLQMEKGDIPQPTMTTKKYDFTLSELQQMFRVCDYRQRAILTCGIHWGFGAEDMVRIRRDELEPLIQATEEGRKEYPIALDMIRRKNNAPHRYHLTGEIADSLTDYWKTIERIEVIYEEEGDVNIPINSKVVFAFPKHRNGEPYKEHLNEENLNDILRTIWKQAYPNVELPRGLTWHRIRAFFISTASGVLSESEVKRLSGKTISSDMLSYLNDHKLLEAWESIAPKLSLTGITNKRMAKLQNLEQKYEDLHRAMQVIAKYVAVQLKKAKPTILGDDVTKSFYVPTELDKDIEFLEEFSRKKVKKSS